MAHARGDILHCHLLFLQIPLAGPQSAGLREKEKKEKERKGDKKKEKKGTDLFSEKSGKGDRFIFIDTARLLC